MKPQASTPRRLRCPADQLNNMSLASSPDYLFRPENQAMKMLFPNTTENGDSFDDFFNEEMYKLDARAEDSPDHQLDIEDLFGNEPSFEDEFRLPPFSDSPKLDHSPIQPWREGVWCLNQTKQPSPLVVEKTRRTEVKRPDPLQTMDFSSRDYRDSLSPADMPLIQQTKRLATCPNSTTVNSSNFICPPYSREVTLSPTPMYSQLAISPKFGHGDISTWQQDFQNFNLRHSQEQVSQSHLVSPSRGTRQGASARNMNNAIMTQNSSIEMSSPNFEHAYMATKYHQSAIDPVLLDPTQSSQEEYQPHHSRESLPTTECHNSVRSPPSDSLPSSSSSNHSRGTTTQTANTSISIHSQAFVSPTTMICHPPLPTLAPEEVYPVLAAPKPQRVPHQLLHHQRHHQTSDGAETSTVTNRHPDLDQRKLHARQQQQQKMMQIQANLYDPQTCYRLAPSEVGVAMPYPAPAPAPQQIQQQPVTTNPGLTNAHTLPISSYPPLPTLPPAPAYLFPDGSPFTPRKQRHSSSRSPSPPLSPTSTNILISPRRTSRHHRSPTRTVTDYTHSRRKSIHKSGPIRGVTQQEPPLPTSTQRARSHSRPPRTPKTPKASCASDGCGGGGVMIDFVNFTPKDSVKLLSDVAPSGSSKTRARREMQARENRKKLSEAALKAVKVAGGDVSVFEKAIVMA